MRFFGYIRNYFTTLARPTDSLNFRKRFPHTRINPGSHISIIGNIEIGEYTYGQMDIICFNKTDSVKIGKFCSIASGVKIFGGGEHKKELISTFPLKYFFQNYDIDPNVCSKGPAVIGNDVWIGTNSIVLSGVNISDGSIIGAGSVVSRNIPPYAIAAGNPIQIIGFRFSKEIIDKIILISWWNWPIDKIKNNINLFYENIDVFIDCFSEDGGHLRPDI